MKATPQTFSAITVILLGLAHSTLTQASNTVAPGWDLLQIDPTGTSFFGEPFEGVHLGTFNFGPPIGVKDVGTTDIMIRRVEPATVPGPGSSVTVHTVVDALQVRSVGQVQLMGGPLGVYYMTLASKSGGPVSTGTMTITFGPEGDPHGTFSSSFNLYVDVRLNSLDGPILSTQLISIPDSGSVPWRHEPTGPVQIPGVNVLLNGTDFESDLWIEGIVSKKTPNGRITARNPSLPDTGSTLLLLGLAMIGIGGIKAGKAC